MMRGFIHLRFVARHYLWLSYCSSGYPVEASNGPLFGVTFFGDRGIVGPSIIHFSSQKVVSYLSSEGQVSVDSDSHKTKHCI